jgi:stage V sporulation protein G
MINNEQNESEAFDVLAVTQVQVYPFKENPYMTRMKALAQVVLNDQLVLRGLKVMDGENGLYMSYPNDPFFKGDDYRNIFHPITRKLREHIENCVLEKYQAAIA